MVRKGIFCFALMVVFASAALTACFEPTKDTHPNQVLTKRNALFKQFNRALAPMTLVANERSNYVKDEFLVYAQDLEKLSTKPWAYFPADGNYPPTHARPVVWSRPAEFKDAQEKFQASVTQLVTAAHTGDLKQVQVAVYGVTTSCKACHRNFRFE